MKEAKSTFTKSCMSSTTTQNFLPSLSIGNKEDNMEYTLVLDLDETLVHTVETSDKLNECLVRIRPGAIEFIEEMSKYYELVIFTAGTKEYADYALQFVDPNNIITRRLYREHATQKGFTFIKDISKLGRNLKKTIIIDNIAENFQLQSNNGIFINSWESDENDTSLRDLMPVLKKVVVHKVDDVRISLRHYRDFQLRNIINKSSMS